MAHENPTVTVKPLPLLWGGEIIVEGANFEPEDEITITLLGPTGDLFLGVVRSDREGRLQFSGKVPPAAHPAAYQLRARGRDATAMLNVRIVVADGGVSTAEHAAGLGFHRSGTAVQRTAMAAVLGILALAGIALLRAGRHP
jgi:hypothetical protein